MSHRLGDKAKTSYSQQKFKREVAESTNVAEAIDVVLAKLAGSP